jgi:HEPN domain-containing protein/predicted nucleotidyltransferase
MNMLRTVKDITERLVEYYEPDRIILYGSYGTEKERTDSDIDLLIIKKTEKYLIERRIEAERILSDRLIPVDITIYTPEEVRYLFSVGSPFIEEVMEKGRLLYMRKVTSSWIKDVEEELDSAVILYEHGKYRGACYHSQQCVEKGLKTLILEKGEKPKRIHDIIELHNIVKKMGWEIDITIDDAVYLNSIYKGRYPTEEGLLPHGDPSKEDAEKAVAVSRVVVERLKKLK